MRGPALERIILGESKEISALRRELRGLAALPLRSLLVLGETGVGKDLIPRALLACTGRAEAPLEVFNCPAIPQDHLESELFGTMRGAYPGALDRTGAVERAAGGVLFLDEIASMDLVHQGKVLRLLESGEGRRLGATRSYRMELAVVAATNENLPERVGRRAFREDLYYRLVQDAVVHVPPLRERLVDVPILARHFLAELTSSQLDAEALEFLARQSWPGNVRQLRAVVRGAARVARGPRIGASAVREASIRIGAPARGDPPASAPGAAAFHGATRRLRRDLLVQALDLAAGNQTRAGVLLGLHQGRHGDSAPLDLRARKRAHRNFRYWWNRLVEASPKPADAPRPGAPTAQAELPDSR